MESENSKPAQEDVFVVYSCKMRPFCHFRVEIDGEEVGIQFKDGSVKLDKKTAEALDALFVKKPNLRMGIQRSSSDEANKLVQELLKASGPKAIQGGVTSLNDPKLAGDGISAQETAAKAAMMQKPKPGLHLGAKP